jgi:hypothetical protein
MFLKSTKLDKNWNKKNQFQNHVKKLNPYFSSDITPNGST